MVSVQSHVLLLIGRLLLALLFLKGVLAFATGSVPVVFATEGARFLPLPALLVWAGFVLKIVAAFCVCIGFKTRSAATVLILFTLVTAFNYHDFGGSVFMKEISIIGGLLLLIAVGPGRWSFDRQ